MILFSPDNEASRKVPSRRALIAVTGTGYPQNARTNKSPNHFSRFFTTFKFRMSMFL